MNPFRNVLKSVRETVERVPIFVLFSPEVSIGPRWNATGLLHGCMHIITMVNKGKRPWRLQQLLLSAFRSFILFFYFWKVLGIYESLKLSGTREHVRHTGIRTMTASSSSSSPSGYRVWVTVASSQGNWFCRYPSVGGMYDKKQRSTLIPVCACVRAANAHHKREKTLPVSISFAKTTANHPMSG